VLPPSASGKPVLIKQLSLVKGGEQHEGSGHYGNFACGQHDEGRLMKVALLRLRSEEGAFFFYLLCS
jgi:hypothetical protein